MSRRINIPTAAAVAASLLLPAAALAFNPQPDPPGKRQTQSKSLGGPDTKSKGRGSWKGYHEVDKSKGK